MSNAGDGPTDVAQGERWMTVAVVHEQAAHATVRFLESARIYQLPRTSPDYATSLRSLQAAAGTGVAVCVRLTAPYSEIIFSVRANC
ncbi:MAG: hypothetical protein ABI939_07380 [Anaerolineaceae bacterium]